MPRDRQRLTLESGPRLDLAKLMPSGAGKPGAHIRCVLTYGSGETITATLKLSGYGGLLELSFQGRQQSFSLVSSIRPPSAGKFLLIRCRHKNANPAPICCRV